MPAKRRQAETERDGRRDRGRDPGRGGACRRSGRGRASGAGRGDRRGRGDAAGGGRRARAAARSGRAILGRGAPLPAPQRRRGADARQGRARGRRHGRRAQAGRSQPAAGHLHRVPVPTRLGQHPRSFPGGQRRAHGGGQALGALAGAALRHLRRLLDPRLRPEVPDDQLAPHPRRQHARGAQALLPAGKGAPEAPGGRIRADAQAPGRQAGRRRAGSRRGPPAPRIARGVARPAVPPRTARRVSAVRADRRGAGAHPSRRRPTPSWPTPSATS